MLHAREQHPSHIAVKNLKNDNLWLVNAKGKAFKATFNFLKDLPQGLNYKIIFMERNFDEIIASQNKMLLDLGKKSKVADETIKIVFHEEIIRIKRWLTFKKNFKVIYLNYNEMLDNPRKHINRVNLFFKNSLDESSMQQVVDQNLYRNREAQKSDGKE